MKKFSILVTVVVLAMIMVAGCREEAKEVRTYTDPAQVINIGVNEEFIISLKSEEAARGFLWSPDYDWAMLKLVDHGFEWIDIGKQEAGGTDWFKFMALTAGETGITMRYNEVWVLSSYEQVLEMRQKLDWRVFITVNMT